MNTSATFEVETPDDLRAVRRERALIRAKRRCNRMTRRTVATANSMRAFIDAAEVREARRSAARIVKFTKQLTMFS